MKEGPISLLSGTEWWRASDYEVVGGSHVVPAEGATIEVYDPFEEHEKFWGGRASAEDEPPYVELTQISSLFSGDEPSLDDVLGWCRRWGLLGILPHRTLQAHFWPRWQRGLLGGLETSFPVQTVYRRGRETSEIRVEHFHREDAAEGELLSGGDLEQATKYHRDLPPPARPPSVEISRWYDGGFEAKGLVEGYAAFFPRRPGVVDWWVWHCSGGLVPETQPRSQMPKAEAEQLKAELARAEYPTPYTIEFRIEYGEPLQLIRHYIREISATLEFWERAGEVEAADEIRDLLPDSKVRTPQLLPAGFEAALEPVHPNTLLDPDSSRPKWTRRWNSPSLYSSMNIMILQDFPLGDAEIRRCENCQRIFPTTRTDRKYCSERCRNTAAMARYRARKRKGKG